MTTTSEAGTDVGPNLITGTIDGQEVVVPEGTMIIRAAELIGIEVPRFCDHPLLDPVAACRACLIEIEGMPKPQPACAVPLAAGAAVHTQFSSEVAQIAQRGVMEFLLINHPLDCPVCDKGGECPLQNQAMSAGRSESRFTLPKRQFAKPISISSEILLDRERCVSCARCTRFAEEIAGDPLIGLLERGAQQQIGIGEQPFDSYFSGNTIQICPVGALTSEDYRFRSRPFDLISVPTSCEHCASGCGLRTDVRHDTVMRRQAWEDPQVNEDWNCDKGRFAFPYLTADRLTTPLVRENGRLRQASWPEALRVAARGLATARGRAAVLTGGRLTLEDAYAYARFARVALRTDDIDMRARATSDDELSFLAARVAGTAGPTYADLEVAPTVLLVAFEPEEESPIVFLRLRKAARRGSTKVLSVTSVATDGLAKLAATVVSAEPGAEAGAVAGLAEEYLAALRESGSVILVGERAAQTPGLLATVASLADTTGAALAWVPRRAGERGAVDAGCLPGLLPGGRPLTEPAARRELAAVWGLETDDLPVETGRTLAEVVATVAEDRILADSPAKAEAGSDTGAVHEPRIAAIVVAGVEADDLQDPGLFREALRDAPFVVSLETRNSHVTALADVVFPVSVVSEKEGTFVDWEGRRRPFSQAIPDPTTYTDATVLALLCDYLDLDPAPRDVAAIRSELDHLGAWAGERLPLTSAPITRPEPLAAGEARLATWRQLLDLGVLQQGEPHLAGTQRTPVARVSAATAASIGVAAGAPVTVASEHGSITLPVALAEMPDQVVWLPGNSTGSRVGITLRAAAGDTVRLGAAAVAAGAAPVIATAQGGDGRHAS